MKTLSPHLRLFAATLTIAAATLTLALPSAHADEKKPNVVEKALQTKPAAAPATPAVPAALKPADRMDINSATEQDLATLPGIGEARAKAIVKGRPYGGRDDLVKKKVLSEGVYDKIKDLVIARQK